ncbi:MAG: efflux RND transporter periplasmic adaptor subunit [Proteobacteria bacterium]|nr:efflux RND transporter periplasmic adaptor subunit [Pseudomonadota bacterium]
MTRSKHACTTDASSAMWNPVLKKSNRLIFLSTLFLTLPHSLLASDAIKVETTSYKDMAINITHTLGGAVPAENNSRISAQISAVIDQFHVDTGYEVKKGDLLVTLDCKENHLKLKQANANLKAEKAQLTNAKSQYSQAKKLNKQGNISKEIYNQREAEESRLKATVEHRSAARSLAQVNVDRCQIKAPFDGYITKRVASVGELTQPGTVLLQLVSKTNNIVEVKINNRLLNSFSKGKNYQFVFNDKSYALKVEFILPVLDKATRNHIARLNFVSEHAITGSVGKVKWQDAISSIPSSYIVLRDKKLGILIAESNTAKFIEIKNAREGQPASFTLDDNTQIITKGRFNVRDGDTLLVGN